MSDSRGIPRRGAGVILFVVNDGSSPCRFRCVLTLMPRVYEWPRDEAAAQARRLLAIAALYDGGTRSEAAQIGGVTRQIVRDWVGKFNATGHDGLIDRKSPGQPSRLNDSHRAALAAMIESGPIAAVHGVVRWRVVDLCQWVWEEFQVSIARQILSRELRKLGYRKLSERPRHHAQAVGAIEHFKKVSPPVWTQSRTTRVSRQAT